MFNFSRILSDLKAAIAARAARDRGLTVLLLAMWGRITRMGMRLEWLVAQWRAGTLPKPPAPRAAPAERKGKIPAARPDYPTAPAWLVETLGHEGVAYGLQLQHLLTEAECVAFLAAVPQAGRILRPLLRMLGVEPLPEVIRRVTPVVVAAAASDMVMVGVAVPPGFQILGA